MRAFCGDDIELAFQAGFVVSLQFSHSNSTPVRCVHVVVSDRSVVILELGRFVAILGL